MERGPGRVERFRSNSMCICNSGFSFRASVNAETWSVYQSRTRSRNDLVQTSSDSLEPKYKEEMNIRV